MKIIDIITGKKPSLSFEVFPPKTSDTYDSIQASVREIAALRPSFMSVTYGASGGTNRRFTADIAAEILDAGVTPLAHLTCVGATDAHIDRQLQSFRERGIENVLALRGDLPEGTDPEAMPYRYASELAARIGATGAFCIGGACYPEGHP